MNAFYTRVLRAPGSQLDARSQKKRLRRSGARESLRRRHVGAGMALREEGRTRARWRAREHVKAIRPRAARAQTSLARAGKRCPAFLVGGCGIPDADLPGPAFPAGVVRVRAHPEGRGEPHDAPIADEVGVLLVGHPSGWNDLDLDLARARKSIFWLMTTVHDISSSIGMNGWVLCRSLALREV